MTNKLKKEIETKLTLARAALADATIKEHFYSNEKAYQIEHIKLLENTLNNEAIIPSSPAGDSRDSWFDQARDYIIPAR